MPLPLYWLALGAFCIGTETFMIAPLLPAISAELGVTVAAAGQLVTVFAITYAFAAPILATLLGHRDRKALLVGALVAFAAANVVAAAAANFLQLLAGQFLLALAASVFMPGANATAATIVAPESRGRAIAVVIGGLTVAMAFGVPIGSLIGSVFSWRTAFVLVAGVSAISVIGLLFGLSRSAPGPVPTLAQRVAVARRPAVLLALLTTAVWATGVFAFYTFVAPFLSGPAAIDSSYLPLVLLAFGVAGWIGNQAGGRMTDRRGPERTLRLSLLVLACTYVVNGIVGGLGGSPLAGVAVVAAFLVGGVAGWAFHPSQTSRLVHLAPDAPMVALSLNQSALYLGNAAGAALGAVAVAHGGLAQLGWFSAACQIAALAILIAGGAVARRHATAAF